MKKFENSLSYKGLRCDVYHFDTDNFNNIPDDQILKAHAVCFHNKKMLLVNHPKWDIWGIPGGTREQGESIKDALVREILEETNCEVIDFKPISYQKIVTPNNDIHYRLQYICLVRPLGDFESDPAGNINKIIWIDPIDYEKYIEKKEFKKVILKNAIDFYKKSYENRKN